MTSSQTTHLAEGKFKHQDRSSMCTINGHIRGLRLPWNAAFHTLRIHIDDVYKMSRKWKRWKKLLEAGGTLWLKHMTTLLCATQRMGGQCSVQYVCMRLCVPLCMHMYESHNASGLPVSRIACVQIAWKTNVLWRDKYIAEEGIKCFIFTNIY